MANFYGKNREEDFASTKLMSFGKSFSRMNGQPLDESEVWYNKTDLENFAKGNSAYVGMKLVYVDETNQKVYQYSVQYDGSIKEIGTAPIGDDKSISVDAEGKISLKGIENLVFERDVLNEEGQPTGQKEEVKFQPLMTKDGLVWVEPSKTTVEGLATLIAGLQEQVTGEIDRATKAEAALDARIDVLEAKEDKDTTYSVKEGEKVLSLDGTAFGTTLKLAYNDTKIQLLGKNDAVVTELDASAFVADGVLENVEYDKTNDKLIFTWNVIDPETSQKKKIEVDVKDLVDTYTAGNGINIDNNKVSLKLDSTSEHGAKYLQVTEDGLTDYSLSVELQGIRQDYNQKLAGKADADQVYKKTETYTQEEVNELISGLGGTVSGLNQTVNSVSANVVTINQELYGTDTPQLNATSRIDTIEEKLNTIAEGAQVNVIEAIEKAEGAKLNISKNGKTVTIDDSELVRLIGLAQEKANQGVTDAGNAQAKADTNEGRINTLEGKVTIAEENINKNTQAIAQHATEYATLKGRADGLDGVVADKADKSTVETLSGTVAGHGTSIADLTTRLGTAESNIENKANKSEVYTKAEIGELAKDDSGNSKTIVQMIADAQTAATYDDTAIKADIKKNTDAIAILNGDINIAGSVAKVASDTAKAEVAAIVDSAPAAFDTLKEIATWIEADETATEALVARVAANETAVSTTLPNAIKTALETAKKYTDDNMVKADGVTIKNTEGVFSVQKVTTDMIEQGENVLILNGGSANK